MTARREPEVLSEELLRPSAALLGAQIALATVIEAEAVSASGYDATTIDLLMRLELAPRHTLRAVQLSDQLALSASHISRMVDRAEAASLVRRRADPDDRRASQVVLTRRGRDVVSEYAPRLAAVLQRVVHDQLSPNEIESLVIALNRIERSARERADRS